MDSGDVGCVCRRPTRRFDETEDDDEFKNCAVCNGYFIDSKKETKGQCRKRTETLAAYRKTLEKR